MTSDLQMPYEHNKMLAAHLNFIAHLQPDAVINIGDLADFPAPSRWNKGTRGEFETNIWTDADYVQKKYFGPLRRVYDGPVGMHIGNHDVRPLTYAQKYAPALGHPTDNPYYAGNMLGFDRWGVDDLGNFHAIAPDWLTTHGHHGMALRQVSGATALAAAKKLGHSIICGHTHRMGVAMETTGAGRSRRTTMGVEVGHMMHHDRADYLRMGDTNYRYANWQPGFVVLEIVDSTVQPIVVPMRRNGTFNYAGKLFSA
nr:metallophosphoesterase [Haloglycomyces albus]